MKKIIILVFLFSQVWKPSLKAQADTNYLDSLMYRAYELQYVNADSAREVAYDLLQRSKEQAYSKGEAAASMRLGSLYYLFGQNDSAIHYSRRAYQLRKANRWFGPAIDAANQLNTIYQAAALSDSSFWVLFDALKLAEQENDSLGFAYLYYNLAYAYLNYGSSDTALLYFNRSKNLGFQLGDSVLLRMNYSGLGDWHYRKDQYEDALNFFLRTDSLLEANGSVQASARSYNNIAACYDQLGNFHQAKAYYQSALKLHQNLGSIADEASTLNSLGALYFQQNDFLEAKAYFKSTDELLEGHLNLALKVQNLLELSETEAALGDYKAALLYYRLHNAWRDSLLEAEKISSIAEMQTIYDTERKQKQIELLNALNQQRLAERRFLILGLGLLLVVIVVLMIFLRQRKILNRKTQELAQERLQGLMQRQEAKTLEAMLQGQEEERQRIALDLHDRLGALLSTAKLMVQGDAKLAQQIDDSVQELRRVSHNLSTGHLQSFGLVSALEDLSIQISSKTNINCSFQVYDWRERLDSSLEIDLYRMAQEAVNNALKYAEASEITIQLYRRPDELSLCIEDDGKGFNVDAHFKKGIGLNNIKQRLARWHGQLNIDSNPGKGAIYIIEIPLHED